MLNSELEENKQPLRDYLAAVYGIMRKDEESYYYIGKHIVPKGTKKIRRVKFYKYTIPKGIKNNSAFRL